MDADELIDRAVAIGASRGMTAIDGVQRHVFMVSEAEVHCDMDGIDSLLDKYGSEAMPDFSMAFAAIGATEIAKALADVPLATGPARQRVLGRANDLITSRTGYTYESIRAYVAMACA